MIKKAEINPITREFRYVIEEENGDLFVDNHFFDEIDEWFGEQNYDFHFYYDEEFSFSIYKAEDCTESIFDAKVVYKEQDFTINIQLCIK